MNEKPPIRLSILPSNVLIADPTAEWLRLAIPVVLEQDLASSWSVSATIAPNESGAYQLGSNEVVRTTVETRAGQTMVQANVAALDTQLNRRVLSVAGPPSGLIAALNALARQMDEHAGQFSTRSEPALRAVTTGLAATNPQAKMEGLKAAIAADPGFGLAYLVTAETLANTQPAEALQFLQGIGEREKTFSPLDRTRLELLKSRLGHAPVGDQAKAAAAVVNISPNNVDALAALGANLFLSGDANGGESAFGRALAVRPSNANVRHQLAIGLVESRQYPRAEKILSELVASPPVLQEIAVCALLEGDAARAGGVYEKFLGTVASSDVKLLLRSSWLALSGRREEAIRLSMAGTFSDPRARALAMSQVTIWHLMDRQFDAARETAAAAASSGNPAGRFTEVLASQPKTADEWRARVNALGMADELTKGTLEGYGFFLYGFYPEAAETWGAIEAHSGGTDLRARVMRAAALKRAGRTTDAGKLAWQPFLPETLDFYNAISFNELRRLLGQTG